MPRPARRPPSVTRSTPEPRHPSTSWPTPPRDRGECTAKGRRPQPTPLRGIRPLLVEDGLDLLVIDVRRVVPVVAGVDGLRQLLAVERLDGGLHRLVADADGVLRDRADHEAVADRVHLRLARVEADHDELRRVDAELLDGLHDTDRRTLVRAVDALEIGVRRDDRLREVGGLRLVAATVLHVDDLDVRLVLRHVVDEAVTAFLA